MVTITKQRDLVVAFKEETFSNVRILSKVHPMPLDLSSQVFEKNALEKPTQSFFNHLSYYLVCIVDAKAAAGLSWPLYDTQTERAYRTELSAFLKEFSNKGLISPVMSSYLVNPSCYKVTMLLFQLSQLAVQRVLLTKMKKNHQKELYDDMTDKYKQNKEGFKENIESVTEIMLSKLSSFLHKKNNMTKIEDMLCNKIKAIEAKLKSLNCQEYIDDLVNKYLETHTVEEVMKNEILKIKNVNSASQFFDDWLNYVDNEMERLENEWDVKVSPILKLARQSTESMETLIERHTGEADKSSYTIEFNPSTDEICTKDLQEQVNSEQKYILRNIIKDNKLSFPNLIRGFLISISFVLKNAEIGDEIYRFNEYLDLRKRNYKEIVNAMRILIERVLNAETRLESSPHMMNTSISMKELAEIPPLPDLSELKANCDMHGHILFDTFTPFSVSKRQFNLHRKNQGYSFSKNQPKSRDDFFKSLRTERTNINVKKGGLFNESNFSNESCGLYRSHSLPNLFENREKRSPNRLNKRKLSIIPTILAVSEISQLDKDNSYDIGTPDSGSSNHLNNFKNINNQDATSLPSITVSNEAEKVINIFTKIEEDFKDVSPVLKVDANMDSEKEESRKSIEQRVEDSRKSIELREDSKTETPKNNVQLFKMTSSLQKIINRYKKVRANVVLETSREETEIRTIVEEKENFNSVNVDVFTANKADLLSPKHLKDVSLVLKVDANIESEKEESRKSIEQRVEDSRKSIELREDSKKETPKNNVQLFKITSSLEKIINRYKKVRANVVSETSREETEIRTIVKKKENFNSVNVDVFTANKVLLPDLLSPSCSATSTKTSYLDQVCLDEDETIKRKPRESLGTVLGVDQNFLDQFDLID